MTRLVLSLTLALAALAPALAQAQLDDDLLPASRDFESPEGFGIEFRIGPYQPDMDSNPAFQTFFDEDPGLMLAVEFDVWAYQMKDVFYLGGGGTLGWADYQGHTIDEAGDTTSEETNLTLVPLNLMLVARLDVLARKLHVPFLFAGKLGYQWMHWDTDAGGANQRAGWSLGLVYGFQVGLDLDWFEPSKARTMDEEWGINHSFLLFELYGFDPGSDSLPVGDFTWTAGLGFTF
jgi:opacity protein-like surface antigen